MSLFPYDDADLENDVQNAVHIVRCIGALEAQAAIADAAAKKIAVAERMAQALRYWMPDCRPGQLASSKHLSEWDKAYEALSEWEALR